MRKFSEKLLERKNYDSGSLLKSEVQEYLNKMNKKIPVEVTDVIHILDMYNITDRETIDNIKNGRKSELNKISKEFNIPLDKLEMLTDMLKELNRNIRLIPQYQSETERKALLMGKMAQDDLTMDLDSDRGRDAVAKQYAPLVRKIVNQFKGKSSMDDTELMSAGLMGLTYAMNTYRKPEDDIDAAFKNLDDKDKAEGKKTKGLTFKQYAGWCVRNQILNDINSYSHTVKLGQYYYNKIKDTDGKVPTNMSIDRSSNGEDLDIDRFAEIATDGNTRAGETREWKKIFKAIDGKFSTRDASIFYKAFGMNGQKQIPGRQIAKEFNVSAPTVTVVIKNVIKFLKSNDTTKDILSDIMDMYSESLIYKLFGLDTEMIKETLLNDDLYILLEEVTRWRDKSLFKYTLENVFKYMDPEKINFLYEVLNKGSFDYIYDNYNDNKNLITWFLSEIYPTDNFIHKSDVAILEMMDEIIETNNKFKLKWETKQTNSEKDSQDSSKSTTDTLS